MRKYKRCSFVVWYGKIQHSSNKKGIRLKAHTLFIRRVLYIPISHSIEHRLHIFHGCDSVSCCDHPTKQSFLMLAYRLWHWPIIRYPFILSTSLFCWHCVTQCFLSVPALWHAVTACESYCCQWPPRDDLSALCAFRETSWQRFPSMTAKTGFTHFVS